MAANKKAVKNIKQQSQATKQRSKGKTLTIPIGNLVYLRDHPAGRCKIQDAYKPEQYVVSRKHPDPNVYYIKPLTGNRAEFSVNRRQLRDLGPPVQKPSDQEKVRVNNAPRYSPVIPPKPAPRYSLRKRDNPSTSHNIVNLHNNSTSYKPRPAPRTKFKESISLLVTRL